ncbi:transcriptional regulator [Sporolactobacillus kofuensis]|uniref:Transcriptional regulator n=1 Tax=Sporolactobacillus kofuensis TaxID=269672 RepID=A0ABW1WC26_9BACL|nr:transcriptional regulator [Sporolactobacillus kofuensis]MCO7175547.1 transcriptional regulator [Sporolactobacillus kofuensis]
MTETKLKPAVFKYIESELYDYPETKKEIKRLREQIIYGSSSEDNIGGGRPSEPGRPTERIASRLVNNRKLRNMEEVIDAIESAYQQIPSEYQKIIRMKYWDRQSMQWKEVADKCFVHPNTVTKYRRRFVYLVADKIGV